MNTHQHLKTYFFIAFLFSITNLYSQHTSPQVKVISNHAAENFDLNDAYNIKNEGLNASDFAKTRIVAARLRLKEEERNARKVCGRAFELIRSSESKIWVAKQRLAAAIKDGTLSKEAIHQREKSIKNAERKLRQLKDTIKTLSEKKDLQVS